MSAPLVWACLGGPDARIIPPAGGFNRSTGTFGPQGWLLGRCEFEDAARLDTSLVVAVPHPSTRSRVWNDDREVDGARLFWRGFALALTEFGAHLVEKSARLPAAPPDPC